MMDSLPWWYRERSATPLCRYRDRSFSLVRRYRRVDFPPWRDKNRGPPPNRKWGKELHPRGLGHRETMKNPLPLKIWEIML